MSKLIAIGDSHVRAFKNNRFLTPIFIGPGKTLCFINDSCADQTYLKVQGAINKLEKEDKILLVFGEPDTRWWTYHVWHPKEAKDKKPDIPQLLKSIKRYKTFLLKTREYHNKIYVYNVTLSMRQIQNILVDLWNEYIKEFCIESTIDFVNCNPKKEKIKPFMADEIHYNDRITSNLTKEILGIRYSFDDYHTPCPNIDRFISAGFKINTQHRCLTI